MALSFAAPTANLASAACTVFRGLQFAGAKYSLLDDSIKQSKTEAQHCDLVKINKVVASTCATREPQFSAVPTRDHAMKGLFTDWCTSSSPASSSRWVQQLEIESIMRSFQPEHAVLQYSSSAVQFPITGYNIDSTAFPISTSSSSRNLVIPEPLSINGVTTPSRIRRGGSTSTVLRVAHPGAAGAHSEAASTKAYPDCHSLPCGKFEIPFHAVELGLADRAVLPIENSVGGSIHKNYDLMLRHRLHIVGEVQLPVRHCLLALPGTTKEDVKRVLSHPQALSQCETNLSRMGVKLEAVNDTAAAAQCVAANDLRDTGAISSSQAASLYGLTILENDFQDYSGNTTRFLMMARDPILAGLDRKFKTSIVFALENDSEDLFRVLSAFASRDINLTKIESRPQTRKPLLLAAVDKAGSNSPSSCTTSKCNFEYLYFVDFEASMAERKAQNALKELQEFVRFFRILGCYPMEVSEAIS